MRRFWNIIWLSGLMLIGNAISSSEDQLYFDIVLHNNKVIGSLKATKSKQKERTHYYSFTKIKTRLIKEIQVDYEYDVMFENAQLKEADVAITVNEKPHAKTNTTRENDYYRVEINEEDEKTVNEAISYATIQLYFKEPINIRRCYSEQDGSFNTIMPLGNHRYKKVNSKGKENIYHYKNGILKSATIDGGLVKFKMIAREK
ncbi:DUF6134 family protein [Winogradskyella sp. PC D3.3]